MKVQLHLAYYWVCPHCEHHNLIPIEGESRKFTKVECLVCEREYEALPLKERGQ